MWPEPAREIHDIGTRGELEVEDLHGRSKPLDVAVLDMASVFPQMNGDAVGSGRFAQGRGLEGIRLVGSPSLADGGDVIDVDVQSDRSHCSRLGSRLVSQANIRPARDS